MSESADHAMVKVVHDRIEELISTHDPRSSDPQKLWGAQYDLGLAWVHFPKGYGGLGAPRDLQADINAKLHDAGAPTNEWWNFVGTGTAAPTIVAYGTEEQKQRFLRPIFTCEEIWCQLFSEPGAGSDLASVATLAELDGDQWTVNGHKVWTSLAHAASWGILPARTDPNAPKHKGMTFFLVDMHAPGVEVRPLRQINGEAEFNEVIMTNVVVPDSRRLGAVGEGWRITIGALMNERVHNADIAGKGRGTGPISSALSLWKEKGHTDPVRRDQLVQLWMEAEAVRLTAVRAAAIRTSGTPGPEASILKLVIGELSQKISSFCVDLLGDEGMLISDYTFRQPETMGGNSIRGEGRIDIVKRFLGSCAGTIGGGTSEMQRNTVAERVLGLPREARTDVDRPWIEVPQDGVPAPTS